MTATSRLWKREDETPGAWAEFIRAMNSGQTFECDREMFYYWLEVLPPVYMRRKAILPNGREVQASFGFAEGAEPVTAFWYEGGRYFGCQTAEMNTRW